MSDDYFFGEEQWIAIEQHRNNKAMIGVNREGQEIALDIDLKMDRVGFRLTIDETQALIKLLTSSLSDARAWRAGLIEEELRLSAEWEH